MRYRDLKNKLLSEGRDPVDMVWAVARQVLGCHEPSGLLPTRRWSPRTVLALQAGLGTVAVGWEQGPGIGSRRMEVLSAMPKPKREEREENPQQSAVKLPDAMEFPGYITQEQRNREKELEEKRQAQNARAKAIAEDRREKRAITARFVAVLKELIEAGNPGLRPIEITLRGHEKTGNADIRIAGGWAGRTGWSEWNTSTHYDHDVTVRVHRCKLLVLFPNETYAWIDCRGDDALQISSSELRSIHEFTTVRDAATLPARYDRILEVLNQIHRSALERPQST
jgi:hypothetical protein